MAGTLIEDRFETEASVETVWRVLMDFDRWATWNTLAARAPAVAVAGAPLRLWLKTGVGPGIFLPARFDRVEPGRFLTWKGGVPGLFHARHGFDLEALEGGGTRIRHHETFSGMLHSPVVRALGDRQVRTYRRVNERLAAAALSLDGPLP